MDLITPQALKIYRLLEKSKPLHAREIADKLHILPNAIYRAIRPLTEYGFIEEMKGYPVRYMIQSPSTGIEKYTQSFTDNLRQLFSLNQPTKVLPSQLDVSFIHNRSSLFEKTRIDLGHTKKNACFIASGLELPDEQMLAYNYAMNRGVRIRIIVQNLDEIKKLTLKYWLRMGMEVKYFPLIEARIIIFDSKVTYITSYDPNQQEEASGVRLSYPSTARIMQDLFEQRWEKAGVITRQSPRSS